MTTKEASFILAIIDRRVCDDELSDALDMAIEALKQQPCDDCISRETVLEIIEKEEFKGDALSEIERLSSVTPQPKIGRWIDIQYFEADDTYYRPKCPFCNTEPKEYSNYCPNCGAKLTELSRVKTELEESEGEG